MTDDEIQRQRARLRGLGWTDRDLDELLRRKPAHLLSGLHAVPPVLDTDLTDIDRSILRKVRALLAKAESTPFAEEAEAFSVKAQELMTRHRIEHLDEVVGGPGGRRIWLDRPYVQPKATLVFAVARANGCRGVLLGGLGCVHVVGYADDLEATELLFTSLLIQAGRAMSAAGPQADHRGRSRTRSYRHAFLSGFAWHIGQRLQRASVAVAESSHDLLPVLVRRDHEVEAALRDAFPDVERLRSSVSNAEGWGAGVVAADRADVGRPRVGGAAGRLPAAG